MKKRAYQFWLASGVFLYCLTTASLSQAQTKITSDGTLSTKVTSSADNLKYTITGGSRPRGGGNLFHSFGKFSVPEGGSAFFDNSSDVDNIISRVTGGTESNIDGLIKAKGNANLFLINPKGIIFGPNAQLDIGGSFLVSTASSLTFPDGKEFSATDPQATPLLTVSVPSGLQFGETPGSIRNQSQVISDDPTSFFFNLPVGLQVQPGKTLALVGSGVFVEGGFLTAPEGRIELGSIAGTGQVSLEPLETPVKGWSLGYESGQDFQNITLSQGAVNTTGAGSGAIQLRGRQITITDNSFVGGVTLGKQSGKRLVINASESVEVSDTSSLFTTTLGAGNTGDITIATMQLIVRDDSVIRAYAEEDSTGQAGTITIDASKSVEVTRSPDNLSLGGGVIETQTFGVDRDAGNAGVVKIKTGKLIVSGGGQIATSTRGAGQGGTLIVDASESVEVSGRSVDGSIFSGLLAQSSGSQATGNAGNLKINTGRLIVQDGARISVGAIDRSTGQGGDLKITASDSVEVTGTSMDRKGRLRRSTLRAESQGPEAAGNLAIATGKLTVSNGGEVTVSNTGSGSAGELTVQARSIQLDNKAAIKATTTSGNAGNIMLQDLDLLLLNRDSQISTQAGTKKTGGTGGSIMIDTDNLVALKNSDIDANAFGGPGGQVRINAQGIFRSPDSDITASSDLGPEFSGVVEINTPDVDPSQGLVALPEEVVDPSRLIAQGCSARGGATARKLNQFVITGRGGVPASPYEALSSDAVLTNWAEPESQSSQVKQGSQTAEPTPDNSATTQSSPELVEAQGWVKTPDGQVMLVAQAPAATPHGSGLTQPSCPSSQPNLPHK